MNLKYIVEKNCKSHILKELLKTKFEISDRLLTRLKNNGLIYLNNSVANIKSPIFENDVIEIYLDYEEDNSNIVPTKMNLDILYEDEFFLIINKPAGFPIHPSASHYSDSISNGIKYYFDLNNINKKTRPVNRLDKDTSGAVIFAKNEYIQECLVKQMKSGKFSKEYLAIIEGKLEKEEGTINAPIARKPGSIIERCIDHLGATAITHYKTITSNNEISLVQLKLETGRTHQIRVHLSYLKHPIIGDTLYGRSSNLIKRQALHSNRVCFIHPITKEKININAPLFEDMLTIINKIPNE